MITADDDNILIRTHRTTNDTTDGNAPHIIIRFERRYHHLQRPVRIPLRRRNLLHNRLHQRFQIVALILHLELCDAIACRRVDHGEIELIVVRIQLHKELKNLIVDIVHTLVGTVNLIDDHNRLQFLLKSLTQHIFCLRHRPLERVNKQNNTIHHVENPLHLTAKVRMPRRIHNIDFDIIVENRRILRKNRDPALTLNIPRVHHTLVDLLVRAEHVTLPQHGIDQRRLAVIDVCDDRNIAQLIIHRHIVNVPPHSLRSKDSVSILL